MAQITKEDTGPLEARLTVVLDYEDYKANLNAELQSHRKKAHLKGFRKGKVPMGVIKKMVGQNLLYEVVNKSFQSELNNYIDEQKLELLGYPIPSEDQPELDMDIHNPGSFEFRLDIGIKPEFEVGGLGKDHAFEFPVITLSEELLNKELEAVRERAGKQVSVDEPIEEQDIILLNAEELEEEGGKVKENGWANTFQVAYNRLASDELKEEFLGKKKDYETSFDIYNLEKDTSEEHVRKYLLEVGENDEETEIGRHFKASVSDVLRRQPAELDQEFFDMAFGKDKVSNEEEARQFIADRWKDSYTPGSNALFFREIKDHLMEQNPLDLPEGFLKKWIKASNDRPISDDDLEKDYDGFEEGLKWSLIRGALIDKYDLEVTDDELLEGFKAQIRSMLQGYGDELMIHNYANRMMENKQQVDEMYNNLVSDKLVEELKKEVTLNENAISKEDFDAKLEALQPKQEEVAQELEAQGEEVQESEDITEEIES